MVINLASIILATTILTSSFNCIINDEVKNKSNAFRVYKEVEYSIDKEDKFDDFWTPKNEGYLDASQKEELTNFRSKVENGDLLSGIEKNKLKDMKTYVIKSKLGEDKFKELEKLINKREGSVELTLPERQRLYQLNKEARG
ncbi:hypothetical protein [Clostridium tertium]|uniref:Uncharacterized protein n=1 Tax=Clostridium tertium TaxID=1559 RepID=A0A6N2YMA8_9CLOT